MDNGAELPHVAELCADGRPGGTTTPDAQAACCGPTEGRRPARAARRTAKALPICFRPQPAENEYEGQGGQ